MLASFAGRATAAMTSVSSVMNFPLGLRYHRPARPENADQIRAKSEPMGVRRLFVDNVPGGSPWL